MDEDTVLTELWNKHTRCHLANTHRLLLDDDFSRYALTSDARQMWLSCVLPGQWASTLMNFPKGEHTQSHILQNNIIIY